MHLIGFGLKTENCYTLYSLKLRLCQAASLHLMLLQMTLVTMHCVPSTAAQLTHSLTRCILVTYGSMRYLQTVKLCTTLHAL